MAYVMNDVGGWGTGALGDVSNPSGQINSYANVTAISGATVTIGTPSAGAYETFAVGKEIMLHVSAVLSGTDAAKLGKYMVATVTAVNGSVLTLSKDVPTNLVASADLTTLVVQAITIAQFNSLTLSSGQISPLAYSVTNKYGGILLFKCKTGWNMSGSGAIYLVDKGIPTANASLRPLTTQETEMTSTGKTTGWENHITARQLLLNAGDGVVGYWVKSLNVTGTANRIGSTAAGAQYYPYSIGDNSPAEVLGGSTILAVAETITGWTPTIISKGKGTGSGYGRCYIATETLLPNDEGLYAQDCISNPARLTAIGIKDFGDGALGSVTNPTTQINSYAAVTAINGQQITIGATSIGGFGGFDVGAQIIVHLSAKKTTGDNSMFGKFYRTKIIGVSGSVLTVSDSSPWTIPLTDYYVQVITVPQFSNLTINTNYTATLAWNDMNNFGGIFIAETSDTLDISDGSILLGGKGISSATKRPTILTQSSASQKNTLPINQGGGAILLISKKLKTNAASRIGNSFSGLLYGQIPGGNGGYSGGYNYVNGIVGGNGNAGTMIVGGDGGAGPRGVVANDDGKYSSAQPGGSGAKCHGIAGSAGAQGGLTATRTHIGQGGESGVSIFIIAKSIIGFTIAVIATGGKGGFGGFGGYGFGYPNGGTGENGTPGGAGYCGGGGAGGGSAEQSNADGGGGGGAPGDCFIYVDDLVSPDFTGVAI